LDITSSLARITTLASAFGFATSSNLVAVLKSKAGTSATGLKVKKSKFSSADHVLRLPSRTAADSLTGLAPKKQNILLILKLLYHGNSPNEDFDPSLFFEGNNSSKSGNQSGFDWSAIKKGGTELSSLLGVDLMPRDNRTDINRFVQSNLVKVVGKGRWMLTDLGHFVAGYLLSKKGIGV